MLLDLDEIVLTCQDPRSKEYIREAVLCYKAGAYRSAVVSCWIAVAFDIVDKLRELSAAGDRMAEQEINKFEKIQRDGDIRAALAFEKDLPEQAKKFEFVSHVEYVDLGRLVVDRNRCAHPSHVIDSEVFTPTAELARLHIVNSVRSVLSRPAASGKSALDNIMFDMASRYFPSRPEAVKQFLSEGPLGRPRASLYRNFVVVLLKNILSGTQENISKIRASLALASVKEMHPQLWVSECYPVFSNLASTQRTDEELVRLVALICYNQSMDYWGCLSDAQRDRINNFVENSPVELMDQFEILLVGDDLPTLKRSAITRLKKATFEELKGVGWVYYVPEQALDRWLDLYSLSRDFAEANEIGRFLKSIVSVSLNVSAYLSKFFALVKKNDQVFYSHELSGVVRAFVAATDFEKVKNVASSLDVDVERFLPAQ
ncbi:hypothetical protein [Pseudomonas sp. CAM1A]|uniref:hypothetical protein n=1 Tax=Pseudomonas sp. CAM1A TaxID=3231717 RepID=UPI0039C5F759